MNGNDFESYHATYCESCGQLHDGSDKVVESVDEPVHRVDIIKALGPMAEVGETVATEEGECECTGQIVKRYYAVGDVPEPQFEPDPDEFAGRDPQEDALIDMSGEGEDWQEVREVPGIDASTEE